MTTFFVLFFFFFFNDTATTEIYTLSLHDALPIFGRLIHENDLAGRVGHDDRVGDVSENQVQPVALASDLLAGRLERSEEHTSELQSQSNLVCRLLLEKKNTLIRLVRT